jgi:hypothetical protein
MKLLPKLKHYSEGVTGIAERMPQMHDSWRHFTFVLLLGLSWFIQPLRQENTALRQSK